MMTLPQIRAALADRNLAEVARQIGMPRQQLWLIASGIATNPTITTVGRISDYLESQQPAGGSK